MPRYLTAHVTSCMTRQDVERLAKRFEVEGTGVIRHLRTVCDTVEGRMVCEWEAPDREALVDWLKQRSVRFRSDAEWIMAVQIEAGRP